MPRRMPPIDGAAPRAGDSSSAARRWDGRPAARHSPAPERQAWGGQRPACGAAVGPEHTLVSIHRYPIPVLSVGREQAGLREPHSQCLCFIPAQLGPAVPAPPPNSPRCPGVHTAELPVRLRARRHPAPSAPHGTAQPALTCSAAAAASRELGMSGRPRRVLLNFEFGTKSEAANRTPPVPAKRPTGRRAGGGCQSEARRAEPAPFLFSLLGRRGERRVVGRWRARAPRRCGREHLPPGRARPSAPAAREPRSARSLLDPRPVFASRPCFRALLRSSPALPAWKVSHCLSKRMSCCKRCCDASECYCRLPLPPFIFKRMRMGQSQHLPACTRYEFTTSELFQGRTCYMDSTPHHLSSLPVTQGGEGFL